MKVITQSLLNLRKIDRNFVCIDITYSSFRTKAH